jgi:5-formyltetrahydrofolate cyclo-ligase
MTHASLLDMKSELRRAALARRDALPAADRAAAAKALASRPLPCEVTPGMTVAGYLPIKSEIDPQPLMRRFVGAGARLALPVVAGRGQPLELRAWAFGAPLATGQWGLREPTDGPEALPDILLVPLVAFDRAGHRIGYGAGYYDMTVACLRRVRTILAIGVAYAVQEIPEVPATERDARLDLVLTEREAVDLRQD